MRSVMLLGRYCVMTDREARRCELLCGAISRNHRIATRDANGSDQAFRDIIRQRGNRTERALTRLTASAAWQAAHPAT